MEHIDKVKAAIAASLGALTALWGWMGWLVVGWIGCMGLDYITGSAAAAKAGEWASAKARAGLWHKCGMIVVVTVSAGLDLLLAIVLKNLPVIQLPFEFGGLVCPMVLVWYIITELGSIAENGVAMGAPVPKWLVKLLKAGKDAVDKAGEELADVSELNHSEGANGNQEGGAGTESEPKPDTGSAIRPIGGHWPEGYEK